MDDKAVDPEMRGYLDMLKGRLDAAYAIAEEARGRKLDPSLVVEIKPASDVAARVEGIVGPPGITAIIRALEKEGHPRE